MNRTTENKTPASPFPTPPGSRDGAGRPARVGGHKTERFRGVRIMTVLMLVVVLGAAAALELINLLGEQVGRLQEPIIYALAALVLMLTIALCLVAFFTVRRLTYQMLQDKQLEEALRQSEEKYRSLFDSSPDSIVLVGLDGAILECNSVAADWAELPREEMIGKDFRELHILSKDELPTYEQNMARLIRGETSPTLEVKTVQKDQTVRWVESFPVLVKKRGKVTAIQVISRDITKRKRAEDARQQSEEKYRMLFDAAPIGIGISDADGRVLAMNRCMRALVGYSQEELAALGVSVTYADLHDRERLRATLRESGAVQDCELRMKRKDGSQFYGLINVDRTTFGGESVFVTTLRDISRQKQAEEISYTAFHASPFPVSISRLSDSRFIDVNESFLRMLGRTREEVVGRAAQELGFWGDPGEQERITKSLRERASLRDLETRVRTKSGEIRWGLFNGDVVEIGGESCVLSVCEDITERRRAAEEIHRLTQFQESIIDTANVWLDVLDEKANVVIWNKAAEAISGFPREEVVGHGKIWEWLYPDEQYRTEITAKAAAIIEKGVIVEDFETTIRRKDGELRIISWNSRNLLDELGKPIGSIALGRDITQRRRAEQAVRRSEETARALLNASTDTALLFTPDGTILAINEIGAQRFGKSIEELVGMSVHDFFTEDVDRKGPTRVEEATRLGKPVRWEAEHGGRYYDHNLCPIVGADGGVERLAIFVRDITEQRGAEEALRQSEQRFRAQYRGIPIPTFTWQRVGEDFVLVDYNDAAVTFTRGKIGEIVGKKASELYPDVPEIPQELSRCYVEKTSSKREMPYRMRTTWETKYIAASYAYVPPDLVLLHAEDITERKRTEQIRETLAAVGQKLSAVSTPRDAAQVILTAADDLFGWDACYVDLWSEKDATAHPIINMDTVEGERTEFPLVSERAQLGFMERRDLGAQLILRQRPEEADDRRFISFGDTARRSASLMFAPIRKGDQTVGWISIQSYSPNTYARNDLEVFQILADQCAAALERALAEEQLRRSEETARVLLNATTDVAVLIDTQGTVLAINEPGVRSLGKRPNELIGRCGYDLFPGDVVEARRRRFEEIARTGKPLRWEDERAGKHFDNGASPVLGTDGKVERIAIFARDITEQKRAEREREVLARLATRLAATALLGDMVGIVREETDRQFGWDAYYISVRRADEDVFHLLSLVDTTRGERKDFPVGDWPVEAIHPSVRCLLEGKPVLLNRPKEECGARLTRFGDEDRPSASLLCAPIRSGGSVIGILSVQSYAPGKYGEADLRLLERIADTIAPALERAHVEQARRDSEERFHEMAEISPFPISIIDPSGTYLYVNKQFTEVFGYTLEDVPTGRAWFSLAYPDAEYRKDAIARWKSDLAASGVGVARPRMFSVRCKDGSSRDIIFRPVTMGDGKQFVTYQDITEHKRAEEELKRIHHIYREAIENAQGVPYLLNYATRQYDFIGERCEQLLGIPGDQMCQEALLGIIKEIVVVEPGAPPDAAQYGKMFREGKFNKYRVDIRLRVPSGEEKWVSDCAVNIRDNKTGELKYSLGILQEITERKRAEQELRLLAHTLESISEMVSITDLDNRFVFVNKAFVEKYGYSKSEIIGRHVSIVRTPHYPAAVYDEVLSESQTRPWKGELLNLTKDGRVFPIGLSTSQIRDDEGNTVGLAGVAEDITERKAAERALAAEKERLAVTLRSIGDCVITVDREGRIVLMNEAAERLTGWTQEEALGESLDVVLHLVDKRTRTRQENPALAVLRRGAVADLPSHLALIARTGAERIIAGSGAPMVDREGSITGVVLALRDITQQQKLEEEAQKAHKLESLGVLAGGIAHDFNNILTAILLNIQLARRLAAPRESKRSGDPETSWQIVSALAVAEKAAFQAKDLSLQLLTFSRGGAPIKKTASIAEIIRDSAEFALRGTRVRCTFALPDDLWAAEVDLGQISQVVNNIIMNAKEAMPGAGTITVKVENVALDPAPTLSGSEQPRLHGQALPLHAGKYIRISIKDTGTGIAQENLARIFDPYFTTKEKGSGLGLFIAYSIVKKHDGLITVDSQVGVGSTFNIYLPAEGHATPTSAGAAVIDKDKATRTIAPLEGKGKILLMDDEVLVRLTLSNLLKDIGYDVVCARDGAEAVELYKKAKKSKQPFDVVIMDLIVPGGMGGKEATEKLREIDPHVKAIACSGYSNDTVMANFAQHGFVAVVIKPCDSEELNATLQNVIQGGGMLHEYPPTYWAGRPRPARKRRRTKE